VKKSLRITFLILLVGLLLLPVSALAQSYSFSLPQKTVDAYWNEDGTLSLDYVYVFQNDPSGPVIEFVDVAMPNNSFNANNATATIDGQAVAYISKQEYQGSGTGFAVALGANSIPPGSTGRVEVHIDGIGGVLHPDTQGDNYASAVFAPNFFESQIVHGSTDMTVTFHLPPGVQPDQPRWHSAPSGFPSQPQTGIDSQGRITYTWTNPNAQPDRAYEFGASFPLQYVPQSAVQPAGFLSNLNIDPAVVTMCLLFCGFLFIMGFVVVISVRSSRRRKLQYFPPKVSIEGHGIKRGLTAVEAAILLEEPMDKIMTMILFGVVKKGAATVTSRDPLELEISQEQPENLHAYEKQFLEAFATGDKRKRRQELQDMMINLVKSVSKKMKGFSRRDTQSYYRDITQKAWAQVEAADTPEVKSQKYDEVMEWTMLDRDYDRRTRDIFRTGPVFVPIWWPRYDPSFGRGATARPVSTSSGGGGGGISLPNLPGGAFAASIVTGVQSFSSSVIGNVTDFTSNITNKTNPVPVSKSSGGGGFGGGGCACACACAGCACACAGGGR
jgi:hypothetical protein